MIRGHGDDAYQYAHIATDFSSNICAGAGHQALMAHLAMQWRLISHYPEPEAWSLERMIAERHGIAAEEVVVTNGATEAIYLIAQAFPLRADIPRPTFSEYGDACSMFPRTDQEHSMLWLCNPNNPTGDVYQQAVIDRMLVRYDLVVVDQSYEHYTDQFVMAPRWAVQRPNMIQIHSLTKTYCVPGLRLGYITAPASLTRHLRRFLRPWSVSALSVEAGKFLLQHDDLRCVPDLNEAQRLRDRLQQIDGIMTQQTNTNFMLCQLETGTSAELKDYLARRHRMLIRDASNFSGLTPRHFRIAAQTPAEDDALVAAISEYIGQRDA
ncbi:MAG: aminotransferase class I/II-fold pyridoxal phosphate-dependent enzyme [Prevotella sp.]|nr:aminotransferase class I/II-fold pyridoxal phosphate-dependent enzyme [Prevotella sp.]